MINLTFLRGKFISSFTSNWRLRILAIRPLLCESFLRKRILPLIFPSIPCRAPYPPRLGYSSI